MRPTPSSVEEVQELLKDVQYTMPPERTEWAFKGFLTTPRWDIENDIKRFSHVAPRPWDEEGDIETIDGVAFTHHFTMAPGDSDLVRWHWVEAGEAKPGEAPIVFLHGIPESWYQWHQHMAVLCKKYHCIAIDMKGFGQSSKDPGDYTWEGVSEQFRALLDVLGLDKINLITHDRGTVLADYFAGNHPDRVIKYARGEQHLYHYHPMMSPQHALFGQVSELADPRVRVCKSYGWAGRYPISDEHYERAIQEFAYPLTAVAVSRYFNSSTFRMEWIDRRTRLLKAWNFPIMIMEGKYSYTQPREFYVDSADYIPNSPEVIVEIIDGGHFWPLENVEDTNAAYCRFFDVEVE